jgi:hypothetical protein
MGRTGCGQQHGIYICGGDGIEGVGRHPRPGHRSSHPFSLVGEMVVDYRYPCTADSLGDAGDVVGAHHADTEHGNTQV